MENKIPRCVTEYANSLKKGLKRNGLMNPIYREKSIEKINGAIRDLKIGFITVNECMRLLCNS